MPLNDFEPLTKILNDGIEKEIAAEFDKYNNGMPERYPLSPSAIGKCALKLARDVAHFHRVERYTRDPSSRPTRLQRVFSRGHKLEEALIADVEKYTDVKLTLQQQRVHLFDVTSPDGGVTASIEGAIDGLLVDRKSGTRMLVDFKSKGAFYSSGFTDSIAEFFAGLLETGKVRSLGDSCYFVEDIDALFDLMSADDFFSDYILQLNSYAFSDWFQRNPVDGVALYYENKNTCAHYEIRWVPSVALFTYAQNKFQHIFDTVFSVGPEKVEPEFGLGSTKCRLCEYNELCHGKFEPRRTRNVGSIPAELEKSFVEGVAQKLALEKSSERILAEMEKLGLTHFTTKTGLVYERKFLKSPKPHWELRLSK